MADAGEVATRSDAQEIAAGTAAAGGETPHAASQPGPVDSDSEVVARAEGDDAAQPEDDAAEEERRRHDAAAAALTLEIVGDLPHAEVRPPENVLFVCKLNPVTRSDDLELIFSRFGKICSCEVIRDKTTGDSLQYAFIEFQERDSAEKAYFKMQNVLIDDRRIWVDFSQSVSKLHGVWVKQRTGGRGGGRGPGARRDAPSGPSALPPPRTEGLLLDLDDTIVTGATIAGDEMTTTAARTSMDATIATGATAATSPQTALVVVTAGVTMRAATAIVVTRANDTFVVDARDPLRERRTDVCAMVVSARRMEALRLCKAGEPRAVHYKGPSPPPSLPVASIRNIGIIAHIDAGKTTLTEHILHLTNAASLPGPSPGAPHTAAGSLGDVDTGSTVTDFLDEERERGITIQSAAVGPVWWDSPAVAAVRGAGPGAGKASSATAVAISLVDTPGHVDFGIEVERTVRVVDGAVVVLDAVEGVEPQSENVWRQTKRYGQAAARADTSYGVDAHVFFLNKLDRAGASVALAMRSIVDRGLHARPALLQLPVYASMLGARADENGADPLVGVVDLVAEQVLCFGGEELTRTPLADAQRALRDEAARARAALLELVSSLDVELLEEVLARDGDDALARLPATSIHRAMARLTHAGDIAPVLCGAAARNIGVQPLLDAIALYLPSPLDRPGVRGVTAPDTPRAEAVSIPLTHADPTALAFKVVWDRRRGPVTFVRVYSGALHAGATMVNTTTHAKERVTRLLLPYADQYVEVPTLQAGQIGVVLGLKDTRTGDTIVDPRGGPGKAKLPRDALRTLRLRRVHVPPPVFSVSVEPRSRSDEGAVADALRMLVRTDPSLRVDEGNASAASGAAQTVLSGMGELHLEIAKHRLEREFQVHAHLGHVRVGYRETLKESPLHAVDALDQDVAGRRARAGLRIDVRALTDGDGAADTSGNVIAVDTGGADDFQYDTGLRLSQVLQQGAAAALSRGPLSGYPLSGLHVSLSDIQTFGAEVSPPGAVRLLVSGALRRALGYEARAFSSPDGRTTLMEPMMRVRIEANSAHAGKLSSDITVEQHGSIEEMVHDAGAHAVSGEYDVYMPPDVSGDVDTARPAAAFGNDMSIVALVPLASMMRYSSRLRALTGGTGTYQMELHGFAPVAPARERGILQSIGRLAR
ncbi:Ribosome-releasing factor 2, mitochondrial [Malassezia sp. CBS 17886]|nr:Ribosome-releasing factor 2, mitochondrial [Malassezia sp. CBS 17886]